MEQEVREMVVDTIRDLTEANKELKKTNSWDGLEQLHKNAEAITKLAVVLKENELEKRVAELEKTIAPPSKHPLGDSDGGIGFGPLVECGSHCAPKSIQTK